MVHPQRSQGERRLNQFPPCPDAAPMTVQFSSPFQHPGY